MGAVPAVTAVTTPVPDTTLATDELLLVHPPPVVLQCRLDPAPAQTLVVPEMAAGFAFTEMVLVVLQPVGKV